MRSSAPEGQHAPRAKQAPPSGSSGATAGSAGATPTSPRPQPLTHKSSQAPLRGATTTLSSQNRVSSHPRSVSGHPQLQRSQQRSTAAVAQTQPQPQQPQQRSPPSSSSGNTHTGSSIKSPTPPLPKGIQPRVPQPHQQKTSPQALPKSQSSFSAQSPLQTSQQGVKNPPGSFKQGSPSVQPSSNPPPNFGEYDDQEWDVNVGHLIIDLDADIAQADRGRMSGAPVPTSSSGTHSHQGNASGVPVGEDKHSLKMKIKRTKPPTKTSEAKHEIVKPDAMPAVTAGVVVMQGSPSVPQHNGASVKVENSNNSGGQPRNATATSTSTPRTIYKKEKRRIDVNGTSSSSPPPVSRSIPHASNVTLSHISASSTLSTTHSTGLPLSSAATPGITTSTVTTASGVHHIKTEAASSTSIPISGARVPQSALHQQPQQQPTQPSQANSTTSSLQVHMDGPSQASSQCETSSPASKRQKMGDEETKKDACVGTSVGTITEPDCLGPCEPGSSVTLEGIVWHETEGGVLVVNVTWRGKTYVGTLLDCTKHDWAPPSSGNEPNGHSTSGGGRTGGSSSFRNGRGSTPTQMKAMQNGRR